MVMGLRSNKGLRLHLTSSGKDVQLVGIDREFSIISRRLFPQHRDLFTAQAATFRQLRNQTLHIVCRGLHVCTLHPLLQALEEAGGYGNIESITLTGDLDEHATGHLTRPLHAMTRLQTLTLGEQRTMAHRHVAWWLKSAQRSPARQIRTMDYPGAHSLATALAQPPRKLHPQQRGNGNREGTRLDTDRTTPGCKPHRQRRSSGHRGEDPTLAHPISGNLR
jgi:hypothetical protein